MLSMLWKRASRSCMAVSGPGECRLCTEERRLLWPWWARTTNWTWVKETPAHNTICYIDAWIGMDMKYKMRYDIIIERAMGLDTANSHAAMGWWLGGSSLTCCGSNNPS